MSVPDKYKKLKDFHRYYSGKQKAPILTIFIGGNHEAMNYLKDLYYGGWVAENIYFLGYSNVINIDGIRIAGVSGIHNNSDWSKGYHEVYPFQYGELKSSFHTRQYEIMKLSLLKDPIDIFISHDWPTIVGNVSDFKMLTRIKPFFKKDVQSGTLGSPYLSQL
jgi:lariat debranching enzyme